MKELPKIHLTIEQQFQLRAYENCLAKIEDKEQLTKMLLECLRLMFIKDNIVKQLLKESIAEDFKCLEP